MTLDALLLEGGFGAIVAKDSQLAAAPVLLPVVFESHALAQGFLSACERTGVSLYPDMGYHAMRQLFSLWYDSFKRS